MSQESSQICLVGNINRNGQIRRMAAGAAFAAVALLMLALTPPGLWRIALFLPIGAATLSFLQAQGRT